jgi:hypothetical protein
MGDMDRGLVDAPAFDIDVDADVDGLSCSRVKRKKSQAETQVLAMYK